MVRDLVSRYRPALDRMLDLCARLIRPALLLRELFTVPIDDNESGIDHIMCIS